MTAQNLGTAEHYGFNTAFHIGGYFILFFIAVPFLYEYLGKIYPLHFFPLIFLIFLKKKRLNAFFNRFFLLAAFGILPNVRWICAVN
jgi:hypothetical protein